MANLKEREQKILTFMKNEIKTKGYPPTVREICTAIGHQIDIHCAQGYREPGQTRFS